jgi:hypothetical protein
VGTQTFRLSWPDRVSVPPPNQGLIRLKDGRAVGFAYGGAVQGAARIRVDVGSAKPQWFVLAPGKLQDIPGIPVNMQVVQMFPGTPGHTDDSVNLEVTVLTGR